MGRIRNLIKVYCWPERERDRGHGSKTACVCFDVGSRFFAKMMALRERELGDGCDWLCVLGYKGCEVLMAGDGFC